MGVSERDVLFDISRRLTDDEIRAIFLSPMVSTTETLAAVSLRFEVIRARREEENLRAENERLREALNQIDSRIGHFADMDVPDFPLALIPMVAKIARAEIVRSALAALAAPPEEKENHE